MIRLTSCLRIGLMGLLALLAMAARSDVPADPVLRIETGGHLAPITAVSSDASGTWIVTASEDKTARLWDLRTGRLVSVLRPPQGEDSVGALYAAAMSPDGKQIAVGGNSAFDQKTHAIYLFDRATGTLPPKSTLSGLEAPVTQLAWSADSQFVAIGLRQEGLRVFNRSLGFVGADPEFNDAIYGVAFAADGRLAVASLDGFLRIYSVGKDGLHRLDRQKVPGKPYGIAWSPDGKTLAVGLQDGPRALLLDTVKWQVVRKADGGGSGNLGRVAWSLDGKVLYAAGSLVRNGRFPVLAFADAGQAAARPLGDFGNTVSALTATSNGLVASSAEPAWTSFEPNGGIRLRVGPQSADLRDAGNAFRVSADAQLLAFPTRMGGKVPLVFDVARGELVAGNPPAATQTAKVPDGLKDWRNSQKPSYARQALALAPGETARSAAALPANGGFVLGSDWYLRRYGADGKLQWERRTPGAVWALSTSADGHWAIAALGDGSIRWYRSNDGQAQLNLFVHADQDRWIAWTSSGYYDTSMGGDNLVGWHVNRAANQAADFFSVGRFRNQFYQPGLLQKIVQLGDETIAMTALKAEQSAPPGSTPPGAPPSTASATNAPPAVAVANTPPPPPPPPPPQQPPSSPPPAPTSKPAPPPTEVASARPAPKITETLPPVIELQSDSAIQTNENQVPLRYIVRSPADAPIKDVKLRVNGKLERNIKKTVSRSTDGQLVEVVVPVPPKDSQISLTAENKYAKSEPVTVSIERPKLAPGKTPYIEKYDTLYLLAVAVNQYPGQFALELPVKDATDFKNQIVSAANPPPGKQRLYTKTEVRLLTDMQATQANVREGLKWLRDNVKEKDAAVIFLAGHGVSKDNSYYFVPYRPNNVGEKGDWVSGTEFVGLLETLPGRAMFFLDTCQSGAAANQVKLAGTVNQVNEERGVIVFASATAKESAQEAMEWKNGAFTKALVEGLKGGAADPNDKLVYPTTLKRYVTQRVRDLTENKQRPYVSDNGIDDPIAAVVN